MNTDHVRMLYDISELNSLFTESLSVDSFLDKTAAMVADHMNSQVCSIYLYDALNHLLTMRATYGLKPDSVGKVKLSLGEGIAGYSLEILSPVCEACGHENPHFKEMPDINEEEYDSYLAVPIKRGNIRIGVIVIQRSTGIAFTDDDIMAMKATASQLASMIENVQILMSPEQLIKRRDQFKDRVHLNFIKGKSASEGYAFGSARVLKLTSFTDRFEHFHFDKKYSADDFEQALIKTERDLESLQKKVEETLSDAASLIFGAHLLMLKDRGYAGGIKDLIKQGVNPPQAVLRIFLKYRNMFMDSPQRIIQEKVRDIEDVSIRLLEHLLNIESDEESSKGAVIVADDLFPSGLLKLSAEGIKGIILVSGGVTSHVGILARSLNIPMVIADEPFLLNLPEKSRLLIDAEQGNIYINPDQKIVQNFTERNEARKALQAECSYFKEPSRTKDGSRVRVMLNVNLLSDTRQADFCDIDGVGLYRTEFPFMIRNDFPSEEEQFYIYRKLIDSMKGKTVIFRTLDIGGDKILSYYDNSTEDNPFLGMRSIRFSLTHEEIFRQQLRAILRASADAIIGIMFPMISSPDDFLMAKRHVLESVEELRMAGIACNEKPEIGIMVEVPSAVSLIEELAFHADFLSVGTNDLIQYSLAVDRTNEKVSGFYIPHHPAVLRSLKKIVDAAFLAGIPASICGDMANNSKYIALLLGMGYRAFSVDAIYIPKVKKTISETAINDARKESEAILSMSSLADLNKKFESDQGNAKGEIKQ